MGGFRFFSKTADRSAAFTGRSSESLRQRPQESDSESDSYALRVTDCQWQLAASEREHGTGGTGSGVTNSERIRSHRPARAPAGPQAFGSTGTGPGSLKPYSEYPGPVATIPFLLVLGFKL